MAYWAKRSNAWRPVVDGAEGNAYDLVIPASELVFESPTSPHALAVSRNEVLSLDLSVVAGAETSATPELLVRTKDIPRFKIQKGFKPKSITVSSDGRHIAYELNREGKWMAVEDGKEGLEYDAFGKGSPSLSPDSKHVATWVKRDSNWSLAVDSLEQGRYQGPLRGSRIVFDSDRSFRALSCQGLQVLSIYAQLGKPGLATPAHSKPKQDLMSWWGFDFEDELPELTQKYGVPLEQAASVSFVYPGSPAEKAGLRARDIITKIDGEIVKTPFWLLDRLCFYMSDTASHQR